MFQGLYDEIERVVQEAIFSGLPVSTCTVQQPNGAFVGAGQPSGGWTPIAGVIGIQCMDAPISTGEHLKADEQKAIPEIQSRIFRHVLLMGFYGDKIPWGNEGQRPALQAVITGPDGVPVTYELVGVESDSQQQTTRLALHQVTN